MYLGFYWIVHGLQKLVAGAPAVFPAWYHGPLAPVLRLNAHSAFPILAAAEVLVGFLLFFGLFTRFAACAAALLAAGFMLTKGVNAMQYTAFAGGSAAILVMALATAALSADFGVDGIRRYARERTQNKPERVEATPVDVRWPE